MSATEEDKEYLARFHKWMSDGQMECSVLLRDLYRGWHHMDVERIKEWGDGIAYSYTSHRMSTYDFDELTRLVFMSHDRMIRAEINPSGPGMVKLCLWKRYKREGQMNERHPTVEMALAEHRKHSQSIDAHRGAS